MPRSCTVSRSLLVSAVASAGAIGFITGSLPVTSVASQTQEDMLQGMPPEMLEMMKRWEEYGALRDEHKEMHSTAGTWLVSSQWWMSPDAPPQEQVMISEIRPFSGGRYMIEEMSGLMDSPQGKMPWTGMAITGFDNRLGKHTFVWVDSSGTSILTGHGDKTAPNQWTFEYEAYDPKYDTIVQRKNVVSREGDDLQIFDMYTKEPDGDWFKNMSMTYTRQGV